MAGIARPTQKFPSPIPYSIIPDFATSVPSVLDNFPPSDISKYQRKAVFN